jgi:hypothetical protein
MQGPQAEEGCSAGGHGRSLNSPSSEPEPQARGDFDMRRSQWRNGKPYVNS